MHGLSFRLAMLALALAAAGPAAAASKLSIAPFGTKGAAATAQVEEALCARLECVAWEAVSTRGPKDLAKARAQGVGGLLVGGTFDQGRQAAARPQPLHGHAPPRPAPGPSRSAPTATLKAADLAALQAGVGSRRCVAAAAAPRRRRRSRGRKPRRPGARQGGDPGGRAPSRRPRAHRRPADGAGGRRQARRPEAAEARTRPGPGPGRPAARRRPRRRPAAAPPTPTSPASPSGSPPRPMKDAFAWPKPPRDEPRAHPYLAVELGALVTDRHLTYSGGSGGALQALRREPLHQPARPRRALPPGRPPRRRS